MSAFGEPRGELGSAVRCKLCWRLIQFRKHVESGRVAPFDIRPDERGEWEAVGLHEYAYITRHQDGGGTPASHRLVTHFGTCPEYLARLAEERAARHVARRAAADQPSQLGMF